MLNVWGITIDTMATLREEAKRNMEAVINRLFRFQTEAMDDLAEYLFDNFA